MPRGHAPSYAVDTFARAIVEGDSAARQTETDAVEGSLRRRSGKKGGRQDVWEAASES